MSKFIIKYELSGIGWADVTVENEKGKAFFSASYLDDCLKDLVLAGIEVAKGTGKTEVDFDGEPELNRLSFEGTGDEMDYRIVSYKDALLIEECPDDREDVLSGKATRKEIVDAITNVLDEIYNSVGVKKYKERWFAHDFPKKEYLQLRQLQAK